VSLIKLKMYFLLRRFSETGNGGATMEYIRKKDDISGDIVENQEVVANIYVMRCFAVTMIVFTVAFVLDLLGIFVVDQKLMIKAYVPSIIIYLIVYFVSKLIPSSSRKKKYVILTGIIIIFTLMGVFITYHVVLVALLPFLYATLYSSKKIMNYVYVLTVVSTIIVVYCGYYYGLCDANMTLLTISNLENHIVDGHFALSELNPDPNINLMMYYVVPRCLVYIAFVAVCRSIYKIVSSSLEKARLTAELEKAKLEAESANRAKSQFLAKMSHEIRTPINAVMGLNEMILRDSGEEKIQKYAYDVKNSSMVLLSIINDVLDSAKIESGMMELVPVEYELGSIINDLYNMIVMRARDKNLELVFDIDPAIPRGYYGDDKRIRQIVLNLLTNAVKYTNKGTVTLKVTGRTEGEKGILCFLVKDTGIGIKPENIDKIYDEFQRFDVSRNRNVEGTGLGMNIAQQFLKLMGSELHIKSEYEKGSEFWFELEQEIVDSEALGDFREETLGAAKEAVYKTGYTAPEAKILVVDDNGMNRMVFAAILEPTKIQVYEAESGKECLLMLEKERFDIIFLDHMMPEPDGIETLHIMKERKLNEGVPVIVFTANAIAGERERYIAEGFDNFIAKPVMPEQLDELILRYLPAELIKRMV